MTDQTRGAFENGPADEAEVTTEALNDALQGDGVQEVGPEASGSTPAPAAAGAESAGAESAGAEHAGAELAEAATADVADSAAAEGDSTAVADGAHPDTALAAERLGDLQRLQAEYVNYKKRVDRDRAVVQEMAVHSVIEALLPVLDDIHAAREHGDLESGPFAAIADKLEQTLAKFGLERYGEAGEPFDPMRHEALMHSQAELPEGTDVTTVVQVLQPGYRAGERIIRPARVAVADPQ